MSSLLSIPHLDFRDTQGHLFPNRGSSREGPHNKIGMITSIKGDLLQLNRNSDGSWE